MFALPELAKKGIALFAVKTLLVIALVIGVTSVGDVANTLAPLPVSSDSCAANCAEV
jgi:hypothetical protein